MDHSVEDRGHELSSRRHYILSIIVVTVALAIPGVVIGMYVTDLTSYRVESTLIPTSDTIETALLIFSVIVLFKQMKGQWTSAIMHNSTDAIRTERLLLNMYPCGVRGFIVVVGILGLASLVMPIFRLFAIGSCFSTSVTFPTGVDFVMNIVKIVFIVCQLLFIVTLTKQGRKNLLTLVYIMAIVSTNICLCVECVSKSARQEILNIRHNDTVKAYSQAFCDTHTKSVSEAYRVIDMYFYSFIFPYCVYSVEVICVLWNGSGRSDRQVQMTSSEPRDENTINRQTWSERQPLLQRDNTSRTMFKRLKTIFCVNLCRFSFIPTVVWCIIMFAIHAVPDLKNDDELDWAISLYMNIMSGPAFVGFILIRKEGLPRSKVFPRHILLMFSCYVSLIFSVIETTYAVYNMTGPSTISVSNSVLVLSWDFFHILGIVFQTGFLVKISAMGLSSYSSNKYVYIYGILWFLAISNLEMFAENTFLPQRVMKHATNISNERSMIGDAYNVIKRVLYPGASLYRLQSCLLSLENLFKLRSAGESVNDSTPT